MADVSIDAAISTSTARGRRSVVFVTADIGYWFYADAAAFAYRKTTDGGATWGSPVNLSAVAPIAFDVWFDQWTPGDSGTLIHTWFFEATADAALYRTLDTSGDTLGTLRTVFVGATAAAGRGAFISGTRTRSGYLYCAYDLDAGAERGLHRSTDGGPTWSANLSTTFVEATLDECLLFPASNTGDNNDCWAIYHDASVDNLTLKMWDSSAGSATESATILSLIENTTDLVGQYGFSASVRHSDGHLILAAVSERDTVTSDHRIFDLNGTGSIVELTAITTNIDDHYHPAVFIDQDTNDLYVAFNGLRTGGETLGTTSKVYYTTSVDNGSSWSAGSTAYMEGAAALVVQVWAPLMGPRFYVGWRVGTTLVGNAVNSVEFGADPNVTLGLTGVASTAARGLVLASLTLALTGVGATGSVGTLAATHGEAINGNVASSAVGTLGHGHSFPISGTEGTGAVGTITAGVGGDLVLAITGVTATSAVGTVTPAYSRALSGNVGTGAVGTLGLGKNVALVGQGGTSATGSLTAPRSLALTGLAGTSAVGNVTILTAGNDLNLAITGVTSTSAIGTVLLVHGPALTGVSGTATLGTIRAFTGTLRAMASSTGTITIHARSTGTVSIAPGASGRPGMVGTSVMDTYTMALESEDTSIASDLLTISGSPMGR
jgi:hypothetical protein